MSNQDPLALLVADLAREGRASRALLTSLGEDEAAALLEELLPETAGEMRQQVLERAAGVPLFLVSCVQALRSGQLTLDGTLHVPWTLREAILQRVVALQEGAHQVLRLAAVIGRQVPRAVLVALAVRSHLQEEAVLEGLEACVRARLLGEANRDAYQFSHDLIREVVLSDLGAGRRALLHRRVAEVLEATLRSLLSAIWPITTPAATSRTKPSFTWSAEGNAARARYAHTEAENAYREVIARLETLGRIAQAAAVEVKLGIMLARQARYDQGPDPVGTGLRGCSHGGRPGGGDACAGTDGTHPLLARNLPAGVDQASASASDAYHGHPPHERLRPFTLRSPTSIWVSGSIMSSSRQPSKQRRSLAHWEMTLSSRQPRSAVQRRW